MGSLPCPLADRYSMENGLMFSTVSKSWERGTRQEQSALCFGLSTRRDELCSRESKDPFWSHSRLCGWFCMLLLQNAILGMIFMVMMGIRVFFLVP